MNKEAQRIAIARVCGLKIRKVIYNKGTAEVWVSEGREPIPDYLGDLNAMHEAVKTRIPKGIKREEYILRLCGGDEWRSYDMNILDAVYCEEATAAQRAEAFLKTLNLWTYE